MIFKKVCLLGDFAVGKTSLVRRFVDRQFSDRYLATVGVKISRRLLVLPSAVQKEACEIQMILWDLEGHSSIKNFSPSYLKGSHGAVVVGDLSRHETLEHITSHIRQFYAVNPDGRIIVALNKSDLADPIHANKLLRPEFDGKAFATHYTSAKTGDGVDHIFEQLGHMLVKAPDNESLA